MNLDPLFQPLQLGVLGLKHRVVMAPLTRLRSRKPGDVPTALDAEYYGRRASDGGQLITADGYRGDTARAVLSTESADAVAFGRLFIANPDLPERLRHGAEFNVYDRSTFYGGGARGYIDHLLLASGKSQRVLEH